MTPSEPEPPAASRSLPARLESRAGELLNANPSLPLAMLAVGAFLVASRSDAGYYATTWYPVALFLIALLVVGLLFIGSQIDAPPLALVAVGLLLGFAVWSYLSIQWAENKAVAWDGANRAALYAAVLALFSLWPFDARGGRLVLGLLGVGLAGIGLVELLRADAALDTGAFFIDARFSEPAGYINANVALWMLGLFPCMTLAADRDVNPLLRAVALSGAGLLAALALLGQSRGWLIALPIALVFYLLASRQLRSLVVVLLVAAGTAAVGRPILAVHDSSHSLERTVSEATGEVMLMTTALLVVGLGLALLDRRWHPPRRTVRRARTGAVATGVVGLLVGVTLAFAAGSPLAKVSDYWDDFKRGEGQAEQGTSRFTTGGTNRYDFWTVAWELFRENPLHGVGAENFQEAYLRRGGSSEMPRFPHSIEMGVVSQTGAVGFLLWLGALGAAAACWARRRAPGSTAIAAAAAATFVYWLAHASGDWFWAFPALTGPAIAMLGLAGALRTPSPRRRLPRCLPRLGVAALLVVGLSFAAPWLSATETERATDVWSSRPRAAYAHIDRARALNPLSARPDIVAGSIALRVGHVSEARRRFRAALERQPRVAYALFELGLIAAERGRTARAHELLRRAVRQNPNSDIVRAALAAVRNGRPTSIARVNRRILDAARARVD